MSVILIAIMHVVVKIMVKGAIEAGTFCDFADRCAVFILVLSIHIVLVLVIIRIINTSFLYFMLRWKANSKQRGDQDNPLGYLDVCAGCGGEWHLGEVHRY